MVLVYPTHIDSLNPIKSIKTFFLASFNQKRLNIYQINFKMKWNQIFLLAIFLTIITNANSQQGGQVDDKGIIIGYQNIHYGVSSPSSNAVQNYNNGFLVGFFADIELGERFYIQPEFLYSMTFNNGIDYNTVVIPLMLKYFVLNKVSLQVGPLFDIILDRTLMRNSSINLMGGIGTKITEDLSILIRYSYNVSQRRYNYDFNYLQVGLAFRLWESN